MTTHGYDDRQTATPGAAGAYTGQPGTPGAYDTTGSASAGAGYGTPGRFDPWNYRQSSELTAGADLVGFDVEATDGKIGHIDEATYDVDASYLVVDTGPWIFGKKVMLPAGVVSRVDHEDRKVYVDATKSQIKDSPKFDPDDYTSPAYRDKLGGYYGDAFGMTR